MNSNIFDSSFFGYSNLPDSIELDNCKLVPVKTLKLRYEDHSMVFSGNLFSVSTIKSICSLIGIELHRPVKGLYCIEEQDCKFFDYLYQLRRDHVINNYVFQTEIISIFNKYSLFNSACGAPLL